MKGDNDMKKRLLLGTIIVGALAIRIVACDSGDDNDDSSANGDEVGVISNNHGHVATLTQTQMDAAQDVALDIQGTSTHAHTLDLTAAQVASIKEGTQVVQMSSVDAGHSHDVTFN